MNSAIEVLKEWQKEWIDEKTGEKIYWVYVRDANTTELEETKKEWEEYNECQEEDDKVLWEDWGDHEERDVLHYVEKAKTKEDFDKSILVMEVDGCVEGFLAFENNAWEIPTFEDEDCELSDYTKLRILRLVSLGYIEGEIINWLFRNYLMNYIIDNGNITDEQINELNKL
jgi:hypothetical protein